MKRLALLLLCCVPFASTAVAQKTTAEATVQQLRELLPEIGVRGFENREAAQKKWETICYPLGTPGNEQRAAVCKSLTSLLDEAKPSAQVFVLRTLERIGGEESVPVLAKYLASEKAGIRDAARRALAANPSAAALPALVDRYAKVETDKEKRELLGAIGYRGDAAAADFLAKVAEGSKGAVKHAAVSALSATGDSNDVLKKSFDKDALLRVADRFAAQGDKQAALAIYRPLAKNLADSPFGLAAYRGLLETERPPKVAELISESLQGADVLRRQVATARIRTMPVADVEGLATKFGEMNSAAKVAFLTAVGTRKEPAAAEAVMQATKSTDADVKLAAIDALAAAGDGTAVPQLLEWVVGSDAELASAARSVLQRMRHPSVNRALMETSTSDAKTKVTLLQLLDQRRAVEALPSFVEAMGDKQRQIRDRGFSAVSRLGSAADVKPMLAALVNVEERSERDNVEKQIVRMCQRLPEGAQPLIEVFEDSGSEQKAALMPLLGRTGDDKSLVTIRELLSSKDADQAQAAFTALTNWPNHNVAADLKRIASDAGDAAKKTRALRGLARVGVLGGGDEEKLAYLDFVFENADRDDERVLALDRARSIRTVESLRFVLPHIKADGGMGERACRTVIDLAHHRGLREAHRAEFEMALNKVKPLMKDSRQLERIEKYLANE